MINNRKEAVGDTDRQTDAEIARHPEPVFVCPCLVILLEEIILPFSRTYLCIINHQSAIVFPITPSRHCQQKPEYQSELIQQVYILVITFNQHTLIEHPLWAEHWIQWGTVPGLKSITTTLIIISRVMLWLPPNAWAVEQLTSCSKISSSLIPIPCLDFPLPPRKLTQVPLEIGRLQATSGALGECVCLSPAQNSIWQAWITQVLKNSQEIT